MTPFLSYLLKANLILMVLYGFYFLFLRRDTFYGYIRWVLLSFIAAMAVFPLVNLTGWLGSSEAVAEASQYVPDMETIYQWALLQLRAVPEPLPGAVTETGVKSVSSALVLSWSLLAVTLFLMGKRLFQVAGLVGLRFRFPQQYVGTQAIVAVNCNIQPFSFFGRIFLNPALYTSDELAEIVAHEQVHCREAHTVDILLAEAVLCLCWFNPVAWLLRGDIRQNLEFYTDRRVLRNGFNRKRYQYNLLRVSGGAYPIVNHFHSNHLKKRIIMMNKKETTRILSAKYLLVLPVMMATMLLTQVSGLQTVNTNETVSPVEAVEMLIGNKNPVPLTVEPVNHTVPAISTTTPDPPKQYQVTGKVTDENGQPIPGTNITIVGTNSGVVSDMEGKYSLMASESDSLKFSFIFKKSLTIPVGKQRVIHVCLYGESDKARVEHINLSGDFGKDGEPLIIVDGKKINRMNLQAIDPYTIQSVTVLKDAMSISNYGEDAKSGVVIIETKGYTPPKKPLDKDNTLPDYRERQGTPQTPTSENVRVEADTNVRVVIDTIKPNSPLIVIDGIVGTIDGLEPSDIKELLVLKDESATALYGDKAKNGAIIITTKGK